MAATHFTTSPPARRFYNRALGVTFVVLGLVIVGALPVAAQPESGDMPAVAAEAPAPATEAAPESEMAADPAAEAAMEGEVPAPEGATAATEPEAEPEPFVKPEITLAGPIEVAGRVRAIWVDTIGESYFSAARAERIIFHSARGGFNTVYLIVMRGGVAMYPSRILPASALIAPDNPDPVRTFMELAAAAESPLEVILVALPLEGYAGRDLSTAEPTNVLRQHPDWLLTTNAGTSRQPGNLYTLDPAVEGAREYCKRLVAELAQRYPSAAGIQLHEMRYPGAGADWGYSPSAVEAYQSETGTSEVPEPESLEWQAWRRDRLTGLVTAMTEAIRAAVPKARIGATAAAIGPAPENMDYWRNSATYAGALQDWVAWAEGGIVDEIVLLNFQSEQFDLGYFAAWAKFIQAHHGAADYVIGAGKAENFAEEVMSQLRIGLVTGGRGVALFSYQEPNIEDIRTTLFSALGKGLFREGYVGFLRPGMDVPAKFRDALLAARDDGSGGRSRDDLEIPEEFLQPLGGLPGAIETDGGPETSESTDGAPESGATSTSGTPIQPDTIHLRSGSFLRGRILRETQSTVTLRDEAGFEVTIERTSIREIRRAQQ